MKEEEGGRYLEYERKEGTKGRGKKKQEGKHEEL